MEVCKLMFVLLLSIATVTAEGTQQESKPSVGGLPGPLIPDSSSIPPQPTSPPTSTVPPTPTKPTTTAAPKPTSKPPPPTSPPTTAIPPTTTHSPSPTTLPPTTTPPTTPTPKPSPTTPPPTPSKPDVGTWNVTRPGTNETCIRARLAIQIELDCNDKNTTKKIVFNVPANATSNGTCEKNVQQFAITWNSTQNKSDIEIITFRFANNTNTSEISLDYLGVIINEHNLTDGQPLSFFYNKTEFAAPLKHSYKCNKEQDLTLTSVPQKNTNCTATLRVSQVQLQAFMNNTKSDFDDAIDCINSSTPDIVPIAVGCALAALVVVVLLAYLYGRRRSQARGYLSM